MARDKGQVSRDPHYCMIEMASLFLGKNVDNKDLIQHNLHADCQGDGLPNQAPARGEDTMGPDHF